MSTLSVQAQLVHFIDGYHAHISEWRLSVLINDISAFSPEQDLLVDVILKVNTDANPIEIVQQRPYSAIIPGTPNILPLTGALYFLETTVPTVLQSSSVFLYYVEMFS